MRGWKIEKFTKFYRKISYRNFFLTKFGNTLPYSRENIQQLILKKVRWIEQTGELKIKTMKRLIMAVIVGLRNFRHFEL